VSHNIFWAREFVKAKEVYISSSGIDLVRVLIVTLGLEKSSTVEALHLMIRWEEYGFQASR
jgi:hypothetical protein